jgi:membrane protein implicated in regulation of membrane protease activity
MDLFLSPDVRPFSIAAVMIVFIIGIELVTMLVGFSMSEIVGKAIHFEHHQHHDAGHGGVMSWINVGGVPLLVLILLALGWFAIDGFIIQGIARLIWQPLPAIVAAPLAFAAALPLVRQGSRWLSNVIPRDETYVITQADLVGRVGEVMVGPLDQGLAGRVRVKDAHNNWHFVTARAASGSPDLPVGAHVLLVDLQQSDFLAIAAPAELHVSRP